MVSRERATQVVRGGSIVRVLFEHTIARCELLRTARARRHVVISSSGVVEWSQCFPSTFAARILGKAKTGVLTD